MNVWTRCFTDQRFLQEMLEDSLFFQNFPEVSNLYIQMNMPVSFNQSNYTHDFVNDFRPTTSKVFFSIHWPLHFSCFLIEIIATIHF